MPDDFDPTPRKIREIYDTIEWELDGKTIAEAIEYLNNIATRYADRNPTLAWQYPENYSEDGESLCLKLERTETPDEIKDRIKRAHSRKAHEAERQAREDAKLAKALTPDELATFKKLQSKLSQKDS